MALTQMDGQDVISRLAGQDLTGKLFYAVSLNSSNVVVLATAAAAMTGILMSENTTTTAPYSPVTVQHSGVSKAIAGGGINAGAEVEVGSGGTLVTKSAGIAVGLCMQTAATNDIFEVKLY